MPQINQKPSSAPQPAKPAAGSPPAAGLALKERMFRFNGTNNLSIRFPGRREVSEREIRGLGVSPEFLLGIKAIVEA